MNWNDMCFICRRVEPRQNLGAWFVGDKRRVVHLECWLSSYDPTSIPAADDSAAPNERHDGDVSKGNCRPTDS
jgi:hypothetical protein